MRDAMSDAGLFHYVSYDVDVESSSLMCSYEVNGELFSELIFVPGGDFSRPGIDAAAFLYFLLAGISYYKTSAPLKIDLGDFVTTNTEQEFLLIFFQEGLGEFAYKNNLDLSELGIHGPVGSVTPQLTGDSDGSVLIPFGGGIDSIVTVAELAPLTDHAALFIAERPGARFEAIEAPARVTGLPTIRAERSIDEKVLRSSELGYLNGHVPVTGILSALAVLSAVATGYGAIAMSNERSASDATRTGPFGTVNHQWSKGLAFEEGFRNVLAQRLPDIAYFSWLRDRPGDSIAQAFASLNAFHSSFRSCNRSFHQDPDDRLNVWCGTCDKCLFVDLLLSSVMSKEQLEGIFPALEPLENPLLLQQLQVLCGVGDQPRPFECVGDELECQQALFAAAQRSDRQESSLIQSVAATLPVLPSTTDEVSPHYRPERYATRTRLV